MGSSSHSRASVLIVHDHEVVRNGMRSYLETVKEFQVVGEASSGEQAIKLVSEHIPDIVLLDMKLPDMDGIAVLQLLRERNCQAAIVVMTGWGSIENVVEAIKLGAEQYLSKPVSLVELNALADRIIETRKLKIENIY